MQKGDRKMDKEVCVMATSTFDKWIVLGQKAAKRMAEVLADPTPAKRPDLTKEIKESDTAWESLLKRYEK